MTGSTPGTGHGNGSRLRQERYYAGIPDRAAALLVDAVLLSLVVFVAALAVSVLLGPAVEFDSSAGSIGDAVSLDRTVATVDAAVGLVLSAVYFIASWVRRGATPGQRLLGLAVRSDADGATLTASSAGVRWLALAAPFGVAVLLSTAIPGLSGVLLDVVVAAWLVALAVTITVSPTKQGLHDRLAGSVVAKRASPVNWPPGPAGAR